MRRKRVAVWTQEAQAWVDRLYREPQPPKAPARPAPQPPKPAAQPVPQGRSFSETAGQRADGGGVQFSRRSIADEEPPAGTVQYSSRVFRQEEVYRALKRDLYAGNYAALTPVLEENRTETFVEKVNGFIQVKGISGRAVYRAAQMDRRLFSKVMADRAYKPSKDTALAMAYALRLTTDQAKDLLASAGYALTHSSKRDIVMEYFFRESVYDLDEINLVLDNLGMKGIGE